MMAGSQSSLLPLGWTSKKSCLGQWPRQLHRSATFAGRKFPPHFLPRAVNASSSWQVNSFPLKPSSCSVAACCASGSGKGPLHGNWAQLRRRGFLRRAVARIAEGGRQGCLAPGPASSSALQNGAVGTSRARPVDLCRRHPACRAAPIPRAGRSRERDRGSAGRRSSQQCGDLIAVAPVHVAEPPEGLQDVLELPLGQVLRFEDDECRPEDLHF